MRLIRQRSIRLASVVFLAALLLVPLLESGHSHAKSDLARPCPVCVAAHHSPATTAPVVSVAAFVKVAAVADFASVSVPARRDRSPHCGRAPPAFFSDVV
jgi:hypothetical protein